MTFKNCIVVVWGHNVYLIPLEMRGRSPPEADKSGSDQFKKIKTGVRKNSRFYFCGMWNGLTGPKMQLSWLESWQVFGLIDSEAILFQNKSHNGFGLFRTKFDFIGSKGGSTASFRLPKTLKMSVSFMFL